MPMNDTVQDFMTRAVHTIGAKSPLAEAHRVMNEHAIRHLPVLEGGRLAGLLSQRDLHLLETLKDVDPQEVLVEEAMSQNAYTVPPDASLADVAREMALHKYGSALILQGTQVLGIFTTTDALRALDTVLRRASKPASRKPRAKKALAAASKAPARRSVTKARKSSEQTDSRSHH